ncbi:CopG family antitoxin [Anaerobaca lacustris]|uniref:CopG family antitoxin n=1 Tax=Anaerobaca lacustris TaxID=3044600 RepID=A0AAW6U584_9BACT|nr:CopG family antitoxin [Sedimentisphaerales bacterium M17dextr]
MPNTNRRIDPLPEEFRSEREAAQFWDTHSITDYEESLEPGELDVDIQRRHFEIEIDQECFLALREIARKERKPVKQLASEILKQKLRAG